MLDIREIIVVGSFTTDRVGPTSDLDVLVVRAASALAAR